MYSLCPGPPVLVVAVLVGGGGHIPSTFLPDRATGVPPPEETQNIICCSTALALASILSERPPQRVLGVIKRTRNAVARVFGATKSASYGHVRRDDCLCVRAPVFARPRRVAPPVYSSYASICTSVSGAPPRYDESPTTLSVRRISETVGLAKLSDYYLRNHYKTRYKLRNPRAYLMKSP